ncbi:MAG: tRNA 2-selenouridine(34) synthase MnmH [bacterium]
MIRHIEPHQFLKLSSREVVIDVRSPGEFMQGHVPGAVNIPLFDDQERAVVGTLYVQSGKDNAILKGLDIALPKTDLFIEAIQKTGRSRAEIMVHCWRGGLRSTLMAEVFSKAGYDVSLVTGGYKAFRHCVREGLASPARIMVLGGFTGSGKTDLLKVIASRGEQVLDLEELASHKGSVFGALGQPAQPTNEQFENNLYARWAELDHSRVIWMEDESRMIGRVTLPDPVVSHLANGTMISVDLNLDSRVSRLVKEYAGFDKQLLRDAVLRIGDRLGGARAQEAIASIDGERFDEVAFITLSYYDKAYLFSVNRRKNQNVHPVTISGEDIEADASKIIYFAYKCL